MKQNYTDEELNILLPALDHAIATTIDIRKKHGKYIKVSILRGTIDIIAILGICCIIPYLMNFRTISFFISIGASFLCLGLLDYIPFRSETAVIDAISEYRAIFHRLEKDIPRIEAPVQLWSDRILDRDRRCHHGLWIVYENRYEKEFIPKDLKKRTLLAEKKLLEMKDQVLYSSRSTK